MSGFEIDGMVDAAELTSTSEADRIEDEQVQQKLNDALEGSARQNRRVHFGADNGSFTADIVFAEKNGSIAMEFTIGNNEPKQIAVKDSHIRKITLIKTPQGDWYLNSKSDENKSWEKDQQFTKDEVEEHNKHTIELALQAMATQAESEGE